MQPVVRPAVDGVETQEDSISGPCRRDVELSGQRGGFVLGYVIPLLCPLTRNLEIVPACGIQWLFSDVLAGLRINSPSTIERNDVLLQSNYFGGQGPIMHRLERPIRLVQVCTVSRTRMTGGNRR